MNTQRTTNLNRTLSEMQNTLNDIKTSLNVLEARVNTLCDRESTAFKNKVMLNRIWGRFGMGETETDTTCQPWTEHGLDTEQDDDSKDHVR